MCTWCLAGMWNSCNMLSKICRYLLNESTLVPEMSKVRRWLRWRAEVRWRFVYTHNPRCSWSRTRHSFGSRLSSQRPKTATLKAPTLPSLSPDSDLPGTQNNTNKIAVVIVQKKNSPRPSRFYHLMFDKFIALVTYKVTKQHREVNLGVM